jgi:hypothetical protein
MALGPRLDLRQSQTLAMTPQLQQAIKLLALSNLEIEAFLGEALESNPLLEAGEITVERTAPDASDTPREEPTSDELILRGQGEADAPLDIDPTALDRDRDTGDWSATAGAGGEEGPASTSAAATTRRWPSTSRRRSAPPGGPARAVRRAAPDRAARRGRLPRRRRCARSPPTSTSRSPAPKRRWRWSSRSTRPASARAPVPNASLSRPRKPTATTRAWRG